MQFHQNLYFEYTQISETITLERSTIGKKHILFNQLI